MDILVMSLIMWLFFLTPSYIIRFKIVKKQLLKMYALIIAFVVLSLRVSFSVIISGANNSSNAGLIALLTYLILRYKKENKEQGK